jgi:hypothetical protein
MRVVALLLAIVGCNSSASSGSGQATCVLRPGADIYDCVSPLAGSYAECGPDSGQGAACEGAPACLSCVGSALGNDAIECSCVDSGFEGEGGYQPGAMWNCSPTGYSCQ